MTNLVCTVGHSDHSRERLVELLAMHAVTAVSDVRSQPYSRHQPQFNREPLCAALRACGVAYVFLGAELGARTLDESCYEDSVVRYNRLAATALFRSGLDRVERGAEQHRIALLCSEKDPLTCHRTILVARHLAERGLRIEHILADGGLESHDAAVARLIRETGLPERDMFRSREEIVVDAYRIRGEAIAYRRVDSARASMETRS
jgi:uncharacterized protein (DUF488 family)